MWGRQEDVSVSALGRHGLLRACSRPQLPCDILPLPAIALLALPRHLLPRPVSLSCKVAPRLLPHVPPLFVYYKGRTLKPQIFNYRPNSMQFHFFLKNEF